MAKKHTPEEAEAAREARRARDREHYHNVRKHDERYRGYVRKARLKQDVDEKYNKGRENFLRYKYGITGEDVAAMLVEQKNCCAICLAPFGTDRKSTHHVDHCHATGEVRALLCFTCNVMLGNAKDNITILRNAVRYLELFEE